MKRGLRSGVSFKLFWVGLAQLVVVLSSVVVLGGLVARHAERWNVPAVLRRVEPLAQKPGELQPLLNEMRAAGGPAASIYDTERTLVASNVVPPLAIPAFVFDSPRRGEHHAAETLQGSAASHRPRPPPGIFESLGHALLARSSPSGSERVAALHLALPSGLGVLVLDTGRPFLGTWLAVLTVLASLTAVGLGAYLTGRFIVQPLLQVEKELVANVAHELRTPLSRIRVALDIAGEGDAATARASLADIDVDLAELEALIDDVLTAARLDLTGGRAGLPLNLQAVPSAALVEESVARFRIRHPAHGLAVTRDPALPVFEADPILIRRVLDNLLENAAKYSPDTTRPIVLSVTRQAERLRFEVRDHGIGIGKRDLERVFSPFFRAERSRTRHAGGVGLGLTLARHVIEAHGGRIHLASTEGEGTTARIELPVKSPA